MAKRASIETHDETVLLYATALHRLLNKILIYTTTFPLN
jgi:hypothetical protein